MEVITYPFLAHTMRPPNWQEIQGAINLGGASFDPLWPIVTWKGTNYRTHTLPHLLCAWAILALHFHVCLWRVDGRLGFPHDYNSYLLYLLWRVDGRLSFPLLVTSSDFGAGAIFASCF
jgi:hypothetical protein